MKVANINLMEKLNRKPLSPVAMPHCQVEEIASPIFIIHITISKNAPYRPAAAATKPCREDMVDQRQYRKFNNKIQFVATQKSKQEVALAAIERQLLGSKHIQNNLKHIPAARQVEYTNIKSDATNTNLNLPAYPG